MVDRSDSGRVARVRRARRARHGFGNSGSFGGSRAEGTPRATDEDDEDLNERVREEAHRSSEPLSEGEESMGHPRNEDFTPVNRMRDVRTRASAYEREYRLKLLHRMLLRNVPIDQIARELEISVQTVLRDRRELYQRLRKESEKLDIHSLVGDTLGFYKEVSAMGLRAASNSNTPLNSRLAALRTSLSAKADMHKFLAQAGVYDVLQWKPGEDGNDSDIQTLMAITQQFMDSKEKTSDLPALPDDEEDSELDDDLDEIDLL